MLKKFCMSTCFATLLFMTTMVHPKDDTSVKSTSLDGTSFDGESFFSGLNPVQRYYDYLKGVEKLSVGEKPRFYQTGYYQDGRYSQFTVDSRAAAESVAVGFLVRFLFCCGHFGTKLETIKSAIIIPGAAKGVLFWGITCVLYGYRIAEKERVRVDKDHQDLRQQFKTMSSNFRHGDDLHHEEVTEASEESRVELKHPVDQGLQK